MIIVSSLLINLQHWFQYSFFTIAGSVEVDVKDQQIQTELIDKKSQDMQAGSMEKQQGVMQLHSKAAMNFSDYSKGDGCILSFQELTQI